MKKKLVSVVMGVATFSLMETTQSVPSQPKQKAEIGRFFGKALVNAAIPEAKSLNIRTQGIDIKTSDISTLGMVMLLQEMNKVRKSFDPKEVTPYILGTGTSWKQELPSGKGDINFKRVRSGLYSDQVYIVTVNSPKILTDYNAANTFVIKSLQWEGGNENVVVKGRAEPTPVKELQDLMRVKQFMAEKAKELKLAENKDFPTLCLAEDTFFYFTGEGKKKFVAVLSLAGGSELFDLTEKLLLEPESSDPKSNNHKEWLTIMKDVGKALGSFHYQLASKEMKEKLSKGIGDLDLFETVVHADLHFGNIFYDQENKTTTFIDVASVSNSIFEPAPAKNDIAYIYGHTKYQVYLEGLDANQVNVLNQGFIEFAKGYSKAFPGQENNMRKLVEDYLLRLTTECKDYWEEFVVLHPNRPIENVQNDRPYWADPRHFLYNRILEIEQDPSRPNRKKRFQAVSNVVMSDLKLTP